MEGWLDTKVEWYLVVKEFSFFNCFSKKKNQNNIKFQAMNSNNPKH